MDVVARSVPIPFLSRCTTLGRGIWKGIQFWHAEMPRCNAIAEPVSNHHACCHLLCLLCRGHEDLEGSLERIGLLSRVSKKTLDLEHQAFSLRVAVGGALCSASNGWLLFWVCLCSVPVIAGLGQPLTGCQAT